MNRLDKTSHQKIKEYIEESLVKLIETDRDHKPTIVTSTGTTMIHIEQNNSIYLLLCLYFLSNHQKEDIGEDENEDNDHDDLEKLLQKIEALQQKNKDFYDEILTYTQK